MFMLLSVISYLEY